MKFNLITKLALTAGLVIGFAAIIAPRGEAADAVVTSSVEVGAIEITVTGVAAVAFGLLAPPSSGSDFWAIASCDPGALTGPAGQDIFPLDHSRGKFNILGSPNLSVIFTVAVLKNFDNTDLVLSLTGADLCPTSPKFTDGDGKLDPEVGGTLQVFEGVAAGTYNDATIEMTANYGG